MTEFLPYAIIVGVVIVFFIVCYILFSSSAAEAKNKGKKSYAQTTQDESRAAWATQKALRTQGHHNEKENTSPIPVISNVKLREREENPRETEFVTTKGEVVRRNGKIVYEDARRSSRKKQDDNNLETTRVLSREEVMAAMQEADKREKTEDIPAKAKPAVQEEAQEKTGPLSDMAAVIAADLAEKKQAEASKSHGAGKAVKTAAVAAAMAAAAQQTAAAKTAAQTAAAAQAAAPSLEGTMIHQPVKPKQEGTPQKEHSVRPAKADADMDATRRMDPLRPVQPPVRQAAAAAAEDLQNGDTSNTDLLEQTRRMEPIHIDTAVTKAKQSQPDSAGTMDAPRHTSWEDHKGGISPWGNDLAIHGDMKTDTASIWDDTVEGGMSVEQKCTNHFLDHYGVVTEDIRHQVREITMAAFRHVGCTVQKDKEKLLSSLIVQEALQDVQKAYAAHPEDYVASMALRSFHDVVFKPASTTRNLVAVDALKVMPYMSKGHYQVLSLLLLFLYSRNSHNTDGAAFRQYVNKYVAPFMDGLPTERSFFQQLDYLRCTALESKETRFAEILSDSYPMLFRYRGFTEEELRTVLRGRRLPAASVVQSFNSPLYKLALVDEGMATRFFRESGVSDRELQDQLMRLAKKRPTGFSGEETLDVLEDISPMLADLADVWDSTLLRVSTLSLLGLYLAQGYVKEAIGEEFDLTRWFE